MMWSMHADEQDLGKTAQAIALIVSEPPLAIDAADALTAAEQAQRNLALHPESAEARAGRAAGIGILAPGQSDTNGAEAHSLSYSVAPALSTLTTEVELSLLLKYGDCTCRMACCTDLIHKT